MGDLVAYGPAALSAAVAGGIATTEAWILRNPDHAAEILQNSYDVIMRGGTYAMRQLQGDFVTPDRRDRQIDNQEARRDAEQRRRRQAQASTAHQKRGNLRGPPG